jgi:hypothetical protein
VSPTRSCCQLLSHLDSRLALLPLKLQLWQPISAVNLYRSKLSSHSASRLSGLDLSLASYICNSYQTALRASFDTLRLNNHIYSGPLSPLYVTISTLITPQEDSHECKDVETTVFSRPDGAGPGSSEAASSNQRRLRSRQIIQTRAIFTRRHPLSQ